MEEDEGPIEPQPRGIWPSMARDEGICMLPSLKLLLRRVCWTTLCAIALAGCGSTPPQRVRFTTDFASGSIGAVTQQSFIAQPLSHLVACAGREPASRPAGAA